MSKTSSEILQVDPLNLEKIKEILFKLTRDRFYGKLQLSFEHGKILYVKKEETIKL